MSSIPKVELGDRIRLLALSDDWTDLKPGALGTVTHIDSLGTIHADWDNGSNLGLIPGRDKFEVLYSEEH